MGAYRSSRSLQPVLRGTEPCICAQARDNHLMSEKFLSRWSKRKLEEREKSAEAPLSPPAETIPDEPDLVTPEQIAALPAVESVNSAEDLMVFLRKGIPVALRMAALRKLWVLDPEIRDFVGDARDYSWDWNVPGGVPVSGPLEPGTDVDSMVRKIFGEDEPESVREKVTADPEPTKPVEDIKRRTAPTPAEPEIVENDEYNSMTSDETIPRRHGGALPA